MVKYASSEEVITMNKVEALNHIYEIWNNDDLDLETKITTISTDYYEVGLDLATTAAYIKATPAELDALLALAALSDEMISLISKANPPKTIWELLANANDEEIMEAISALGTKRDADNDSVSEYIYKQMVKLAGPSVEQRVAEIKASDIAHVRKKGEEFKALSDWEVKFLKSIASQRANDKKLSDKQMTQLVRILNSLADKEVITRNSIDKDNAICDRILDALGK